MFTHAEKTPARSSQTPAQFGSRQQISDATVQAADNGPEALAQGVLQAVADSSAYRPTFLAAIDHALRLRSFLATGDHTLTPVLISRTGQELATCKSTSFEIVVNPLLPTTGEGVEIVPIVPIVPIDATNTP